MPQWTESDRKILDLESKIDACYQILESVDDDNGWKTEIGEIWTRVSNLLNELNTYNKQWEEEE